MSGHAPRWSTGTFSTGSPTASTTRSTRPPATCPRASRRDWRLTIHRACGRTWICSGRSFRKAPGTRHDDLDQRVELTPEQRPTEPRQRRFAPGVHRQRARPVCRTSTPPGACLFHRSRRHATRAAAPPQDDARRLQPRDRGRDAAHRGAGVGAPDRRDQPEGPAARRLRAAGGLHRRARRRRRAGCRCSSARRRAARGPDRQRVRDAADEARPGRGAAQPAALRRRRRRAT